MCAFCCRVVRYGLGVPFSAIVCSLYCFDYTWAANGISSTRRHALIEQGWPYFIGFGEYVCSCVHAKCVCVRLHLCIVCLCAYCVGTPLTVLTFFLPFYQYLAVYASLFPFTLILAMTHSVSAHANVQPFTQLLPHIRVDHHGCAWVDCVSGRGSEDGNPVVKVCGESTGVRAHPPHH